MGKLYRYYHILYLEDMLLLDMLRMEDSMLCMHDELHAGVGQVVNA